MTSEEHEDLAGFVAARSPALLRTAFLITGDAHAAEDLLQSALLRTMRHWSRVRDRGSLEAFVRQVMVNERRGWFRRRASGEVVVRDPAGLALSPAAPDGSSRVDDVDELRRALATLTHRQRVTVVLRYFDDLPEQEVAHIMGCSVGTVKSQTNKALARLRIALEPAGPLPRPIKDQLNGAAS